MFLSRSLLAPAALLATTLVAGCAADSTDDLGEAEIALMGYAPSGALYRLHDTTLTVATATGTPVAQFATDPSSFNLTAPLDAGGYALTLEPGWSIQRIAADGAGIPVAAQLLSPNPQAFDISAGNTTYLGLRFRVETEIVEIGGGELVVNPEFEEVPAGLRIEVSATDLYLHEGQPTSFRVRLSSAPADVVTVSVTPSAATSVSATSLVFTPANWDQDQHVIVHGIEDDDIDPASGTIQLHAPGAITASIRVYVSDNDHLSLVTDATSLQLLEGTSQTITYRLSHRPSADVVVQVQASSSSLAVTPTTFVITPETFDQPRPVTIAASLVDGDRFEGVTAYSSSTSTSSVLVHVVDSIF